MPQKNLHEALYDLATTYWVARSLHVAAELGVADALNDTPQTAETLARTIKCDGRSLFRLLRLLAAHGVFEFNDEKWKHTPASRLLREDHPQSMRAFVRMIGLPVVWNAFGSLLHSVRTGEAAFKQVEPGGIFAFFQKNPQESRIFNAAMTAKAHSDIAAILPAYDFSPFNRIADVGGGRGHLLIAILKAAPKSTGVIFDLPHVVAGFSETLGGRLNVHPGDFFKDAVPPADAYTLMNIIHDWDDADSTRILSAIRRDAPAHARVLVIETVVPESAGPHLSKSLDINMMVLTDGMERTRSEYEKLFATAGLRLQRIVDTASPYSVIEAVLA